MCLKLLKTGQVVASQQFKQYFMQAAKDIQLLSEQQLLDPKRLQLLKEQLEKMATGKGEPIKAKGGDLGKYFHKMQKKLNKMKKVHEEELKEILQQVTTFNNEDYSQ
jgi:hypothetical protein